MSYPSKRRKGSSTYTVKPVHRHDSGRRYSPTPASRRRRSTASYFIPLGGGARVGWRIGQGFNRFRKSGGVYVSGKAARRTWTKGRSLSSKVRHPIRTSRPYRWVDRKIPFYRWRQARRYYTDVAADAAVLYYGGKKAYQYSRRFGAPSNPSPTRTAYGFQPVQDVSSAKRVSGAIARRRGRCPPGYYYSRKYKKCLRSKFS